MGAVNAETAAMVTLPSFAIDKTEVTIGAFKNSATKRGLLLTLSAAAVGLFSKPAGRKN